jgi:hypothetical protein
MRPEGLPFGRIKIRGALTLTNQRSTLRTWAAEWGQAKTSRPAEPGRTIQASSDAIRPIQHRDLIPRRPTGACRMKFATAMQPEAEGTVLATNGFRTCGIEWQAIQARTFVHLMN